MSVKNTFLNDLNDELSFVSSNELKEVIGDSTGNNRTPSVRQVVRYLNEIGEDELALQLEVVYNSVKATLQNNRDTFNFRTDAFDINELIFVVENINGNASRKLTSVINSLPAIV